MAAMSGEEFMTKVTNPDRELPLFTAEQFSVAAASVVALISLSPEKFDKDTIIETIQTLAQRMPDELVTAGTLHALRTAQHLTG